MAEKHNHSGSRGEKPAAGAPGGGTKPPGKVLAVIPAAGLGTRMAAGKPGAKRVAKQFLQVGGTPVLLHTLRHFAEVAEVTRIVVALRKGESQEFESTLAKEKYASRVELVEGGETRQDSVANALQKLAAEPDGSIVLVHDGVRPFADADIIRNVITAVERHEAAIAGTPAVDTVKQVERTADGAIVTSTIPRERVVMAQTPQGFRLGLLRRAFAEAAAVGFNGTDEASLVERLGAQVAVVMGSPRNLKITSPADMELAEFLLKQQSARH